MKQLVLDKGRHIAVHFHGKKVTPDAIPLVLLHGFCEDSSLWERLVPALADIPVMAIDLPGFGASDLPVSPDITVYAAAVLAVLDAFKLRRCVLIGHSLGGYVALEFAARHGERLAGFGLFHAHPFADDETRKAARMRGIDMLRAGKRDMYVSQLFPNLFAPAFAQAHPEVVQRLITQGKKQPAEGIIAALQAMMSRPDHQETLKQTACPVLFLLGAADGLVPLESAWKAVMEPNIAQVEVLEGVGHMGMFEAGERVHEALKTFYGVSNH